MTSDPPGPLLVMLAGLPGTGKSTLATHLLRELPGSVLCSLEAVRRRRGHRGYRPEHNLDVFEELYDHAQDALLQGSTAILDANHTQRHIRAFVYRLGDHFEVPVVVVECRCETAEAERRIARRRTPDDGLFTDGNDPRVHRELHRRWQPIEDDFRDSPGNVVHLVVETDATPNPRVEIRTDSEERAAAVAVAERVQRAASAAATDSEGAP